MFCPVCHAEYVQGFTLCKDCHVELVPELQNPEGDVRQVAPAWSGDDRRIFSEVCAALKRERIPFRTESREGYWRYMAETSRGAFHVYVPPDLASQAKDVIGRLLSAEELEELAESGALELPDVDVPSAPDSIELPENWDPEEATREIWIGNDLEMHDMIAASLRENGILCRSESTGAATGSREPVEQKVLVLPEDESRAKGIVCEIIDGTPSL